MRIRTLLLVGAVVSAISLFPEQAEAGPLGRLLSGNRSGATFRFAAYESTQNTSYLPTAYATSAPEQFAAPTYVAAEAIAQVPQVPRDFSEQKIDSTKALTSPVFRNDTERDANIIDLRQKAQKVDFYLKQNPAAVTIPKGEVAPSGQGGMPIPSKVSPAAPPKWTPGS